MNVAAHNIVNQNTDGFVPGRMTSAAMTGNGGVLPIIEPYSVMGAGHSQTETAGDMVSVLLAKTAFSAAATLIRTEKDARESLMEAFG